MAQRPVELNVEPNEIIIGPRRLKLRVRASLDLEIARSAIELRSVPSNVQLSGQGRTATVIPDTELSPGPHVLSVGELVSTKGKKLADPFVVPFFVSDSIAKIGPSLFVQSIVRLKVEQLGTVRVSAAKRPEGRFIELMKAVDRKSGRPIEFAFDHRGKRIDADKVFTTIGRARQKYFGKLHPALKAAVKRSGNDKPMDVAVWITVPPLELPEKRTRGATAKPPRAEAARARSIAELTQRACALLREHGAKEPRPDPHVPVVFARVAARALEALQKRKEVAAIFLHETEGELDLTNSMAIAQSTQVQSTLNLTGRGVNVAVYEDGPDDTTDLAITARFLTDPDTSDHSRHTHGIIRNTEPGQPHGHARGCNLHSANSMDLAAVAWAAQTRGCTVISQSFHRDSEQTESGLSFDDMYKDYVALQWPYPTILHAAGNGSSTEFVNHKGYNTLTVGNHNDTATGMAGDSVLRNPASTHSDRELPELAANGTSVTAVKLTKSGTSMAAPAAAGCTALMQEADATLQSWPEGCRAILLAGASKNVAGNTWWTDRNAAVDASDGSGSVDALESVRITRSRRTRGAAATRRGWDVGTLRTSDIGAADETTFSYNVTVPRLLFGTRVKVALAWDSTAFMVTLPFPFIQLPISVLTVDLDLMVYDRTGALVGYSGSWDNSYEIAEFAARAGETYTIKIRRWSGDADVWYGIAWTVQGTSVIRPDWDVTVIGR
jgi:hypothetical protein